MSDKWDVIFSYSRKQAIEDGVLIDVTPMAKEAGIRYPVALTETLWNKYIVPDEEGRQKYGQSEDGRLWDVLWIFRTMASRTKGNILFFQVLFVLDSQQKFVDLKAVCGPGDTPDPVITIMLPDED